MFTGSKLPGSQLIEESASKAPDKGSKGVVSRGRRRQGTCVDASASSSYSDYIGGNTGYMYYATISNSSSTGAVTAQNATDVGGFIGYTEQVSVDKGFSTGSVSTTLDTSMTSEVRAGGFIGGVKSSLNVSRSYSTGNVSATGSGAMGVGSFIGGSDQARAVNIIDSFSRGNASGTSYVAGIFGETVGNTTTITVRNFYFTGTLTVGVGGVKDAILTLGESPTVYPTLKGVLYVTGSTSTTTGAVKKTTAQMKSLSTYTGAGFSKTVWAIKATKNGGFAYIK